MKTVAWKNMFE